MDFDRSEYEIQNFGFSVEQIKLEHHLMVKKLLEKLVKEFAESLIKKSNISVDTSHTVRSATKNVTSNIYSSCKDILNEFDVLFERHFRIPDNVLLAEDIRHDNETDEDEQKLHQEAEELEKKFKENTLLLSTLGAEMEMHKKIRSLLNKENEMANNIEDLLDTRIELTDVEELFRKVNKVDKKN